MTDALIYGDTLRSPELRHEVPVTIPDPFCYLERDGRRIAILIGFEHERTRAAANGDGLELVSFEELGWDELMRSTSSRDDALYELVARACEHFDLRKAAVPADFPLGLGELLRGRGIELEVAGRAFSARRRVKNEAELEGIRRAQRASDAALAAVATLLREADVEDGGLVHDGEPLTCERLRRVAEVVIADHDASGEDLVIVSHGPQTADGHEWGSGQVRVGEPVLADIFPRDRGSACYADTTRTWCVGEPPEELLEYHKLSFEALQRTLAACRPGVSGRELHRVACRVFEEAGYPTQLSKQAGEALRDGFYHALGHGVGLAIHESPRLARDGEDLVLITEDGAEVITDYSYALEP